MSERSRLMERADERMRWCTALLKPYWLMSVTVCHGVEKLCMHTFPSYLCIRCPQKGNWNTDVEVDKVCLSLIYEYKDVLRFNKPMHWNFKIDIGSTSYMHWSLPYAVRCCYICMCEWQTTRRNVLNYARHIWHCWKIQKPWKSTHEEEDSCCVDYWVKDQDYTSGNIDTWL